MVYAGLVGACVGSFLNVCVYRWPEDKSVVSPPSSCPACGTRIRWYDNVPVLGWLWLRGKCRACGNRISVQYPLVELFTALLWVMAVWRFGWDWQALATALFFTILLGIALSDAATYIIPDQFTIGGTVLGLALSFAPGGSTRCGRSSARRWGSGCCGWWRCWGSGRSRKRRWGAVTSR